MSPISLWESCRKTVAVPVVLFSFVAGRPLSSVLW
jgi:hypothetical protein